MKKRGGVRVAKRRDLRRDVESVWKNHPTVEQLVEHLCTDKKMREYYLRHKRQPLTKCVENIIEILSRRNNSTDDSESPVTKKRRKIDEKEETLQRIEALHRQSDDVLNDSGGVQSSSVASASTLGGDDSSTSTSVDAVYEEKFEPEFDLMKSMIRENLRGKSKKEVKEVLELEVVDNKEVHLMNEEGKLCDGLSEINKNDNRDGNKSNRPLFEDLGGMDGVIDHLEKRVILPLIHPDLNGYGVKPITGILLCGPPGCGKTTLARAIANESRVPFYNISSTELVSGVSGASEENIRELFSKANVTAPSIVFIDEIDAIASKRENLQSGMVVRIVTQLMTCMDEACSRVKPNRDNVGSESSHCRPGYVLVIGATNRPNAIDPALRRPGRFGCEISLGVPDEHARVEILSLLTCNLRVEGSFDLVKVARSTPGFVGADLKDLVDEATNLAMDRVSNKRKLELSKEQMNGAHTEKWWRSPFSDGEMKNFSITMADFEVAAKKVQPSSKREGFSNIPNVKWDDVGGLHLLRQAFERDIISRIKFPEFYEDSGLDMETGFLLYGPPGCGKTLIAKAVANEAGANFIYIKAPELLNKYVGESELAVRTLFIRARTCSPCILFFDEVDALTAKHDKEGGGCQLWKQLLIELDGAEQRRGVYVIGATNRPKDMDPALLRPGRFGKLIYVSLPSPDERGMILKALARNKLIDANVDLMALGKSDACENFSGADLNALINEAVMESIEDRRLASSSSSDWRSCSTAKTVKLQHFKRALKAIGPSVSDISKYENL